MPDLLAVTAPSDALRSRFLPSLWPLWQQMLLAAAVMGGSLLGLSMLEPALGDRLPFLPVFGALLILVLMVRPSAFLLGAVVGGAGAAWRVRSGTPAVDLALFAIVVALAGSAAWLSARVQDRMRTALRLAERQREALRVTLASIADAVITTDAGGGISFMNDVACATTGWRRDEAVGRPARSVLVLVDAASGRAVADPVQDALRGQAVKRLVDPAHLVRRDGSVHPVETSAAPIRDVAGRVTGVVVVFRDISERWLQEQARSESEARFRIMADTAPVLVWMSGADGAGTWFNRPWLDFTGRTMVDELGDGWSQGLHPDDRHRVLAEYRAAFDAQRPFSIDFRLRRHDGEYRWLLDNGTPRRDALGGFLGFIGSCLDITDRKESEARLARSEALFRRIADANLVGVGFGELDGRLSYVNDEMLRMMGRTRQDFEAGRIDWTQAVAPEFADAHAALGQQLMRDGTVSGYRRAFLRPDGVRTPYLGAAALLQQGEGAHVSIALDLTQLERTEEARALLVAQLRSADRRKDEFLATLAHELRNPLAPAMHAAQILRHPAADGAARADAAVTIERQLRQMVRLIDDLLDVGRITHDRLELRLEPLRLDEVLEQVAESCRPLLAAAGQSLELQLPAQPVWLHADPVRLVQVFANLVGNAGKFSPHGAPVQIHVELQAPGVAVHVRDRGIGIEPAQLPGVFEMFAQGRRQPGRVQRGLGIGLALTRRLVELHGGTVEAHSAGAGHGSDFVVRLPRVAPALVDGASGAPLPATPPPERPTAGRVLVVDDNPDAAETLAALLEMAGYATCIAHDGPQALARATEFRPHAVLLDIGLPLLDGHAVARRLREQAWSAKILIAALTGWGQQVDRQASADAGFDLHLVKPVDGEMLLELLAARVPAAVREACSAGPRAMGPDP